MTQKNQTQVKIGPQLGVKFGHLEVSGGFWKFLEVFNGFIYMNGYTFDDYIYFEYFQVLSDPEKKRQYDLHGPMESQNSRPSRGRHGFYEQDPTHGFESDMSAEEIFNMFFGEIDLFLNFQAV